MHSMFGTPFLMVGLYTYREQGVPKVNDLDSYENIDIFGSYDCVRSPLTNMKRVRKWGEGTFGLTSVIITSDVDNSCKTTNYQF